MKEQQKECINDFGEEINIEVSSPATKLLMLVDESEG